MDSNIGMGAYDPSPQVSLINDDLGTININLINPVAGNGESTAIKNLLNCRKGRFKTREFENYSKRAIESLIKKIKDNKGNLDNLVKTVTIYKSSDTPCICIGRTLDGRLQVAGKKGFPHVIFARIWRWPDLQKNDLKHLPNCKFPFEMKLEYVCVNPYHYARITDSVFPDMSCISNDDFSIVTSKFNPDMNNKADTEHLSLCQSDITPSIPYAQVKTNGQLFFKQNFLMESEYSSASPPNVTKDDTLSRHDQSMVTSGEFVPKSRPFSADATNFGPSEVPNGMTSTDSQVKTAEDATPFEFWCTVIYHEFEVTVGEPFKVPITNSAFTIDGYFDVTGSSGSRMSLGQYTNIHRTNASDRTRMYVGKGIELRLVNENEIYLYCHSDYSIFVESFYLDEMLQKPLGSFVHKIYPKAYLKFFNFESCYRSMNSCITSHIKDIDPATLCDDEALRISNRSLVNSLVKHCGVRLSFVKGWGPDYPRHFIHNTPCWIEIIFTRAVIMMNRLLGKQGQDPFKQHTN